MELQKPEKVRKAIQILYITLVISIAQSAFELLGMTTKEAIPQTVLYVYILFFIIFIHGLILVNIWLIGRRKNWARWSYLIWLIIATTLVLKKLLLGFFEAPFSSLLTIAYLILEFIAACWLFQSEANEWFKKSVDTKNA
jgi:hypothetical protein